ncbi:MAG: hypothetical protein HY754_04355 [Nitrospirae bacterium]|nr:hypothetical protein [Nitrospirota bacterium]
MTTNKPVPTTIKSMWNPVRIESSLYTATPQLSYLILYVPPTQDIEVEETKVEDEKLFQLFSEFAEEDMKMAEAGLNEYAEILKNEDKK